MPRPHTTSDQGPGVELAVGVWQRRKWLALSLFVLSLAGVVSLTLSLPNLYRATATVLVEPQQVSEVFVRPSVTAELETRIQTIHKEVMSRARLSDVISKFNLYPELRSDVPVEALVDRMRKDVEFGVSGVDQATGRNAAIAFSVSYTGTDPLTVSEVTNTLVASYVDENTKSRERQAIRTAEFLKTQLDEVKRTLDAQLQRQGEFKLLHSGELPDQMEVNLSALDRLNTQLRQNGEYQLRALERRERLESQLHDAPSGPRITDESGPAARLRTLNQRLSELRRTFSDQYPDIIRIKSEIAALQAESPDSGSNGEAPASSPGGARERTRQAIAQVDNELSSLEGEEALLRRLIGDYEARVENAPKRQQELQQLSQDYAISKERYDSFLKRYEEAQVAESLEQGRNVEQLRILDPAIPPLAPAAPNRLWLLVLGFAGSLALAFAAVVAAEKVDTTFHTVDDLRAFTSVPTIAVIRRIAAPGANGRGWLRSTLVGAGLIVLLAGIVAAAYYVGTGNEQIVRIVSRGRL